MAKHHTVQDKYLKQWETPNSQNQLYIYFIPENKVLERGSKWKGFYRENYNILEDENNAYYLPEEVTSLIDAAGIRVIRDLNCLEGKQLSGKDRSVIAFYFFLMFRRPP